MHVRRAAALELQLPHARPVLAPRAQVALAQRLHVPLEHLPRRDDGQPVAGVGQRDHRREPAGPVERRVVQLAQPPRHPRPRLPRPRRDRRARRRLLRPLAGRDVRARRPGPRPSRARRALPLAGALPACPVVARDGEHARPDRQLPPRTLRERARLLGDRGQQRGRGVDELGGGEPGRPQRPRVIRNDRRSVPGSPGPIWHIEQAQATGPRLAPGRRPGRTRPASAGRSCLRPAAAGRPRLPRPPPTTARKRAPACTSATDQAGSARTTARSSDAAGTRGVALVRPPEARRSALDPGTTKGGVDADGQGCGGEVVAAVSLPRRRFRGLTARSHSRKGHGGARGVTEDGGCGPCPRAPDLSEATPRRRGRAPEAEACGEQTVVVLMEKVEHGRPLEKADRGAGVARSGRAGSPAGGSPVVAAVVAVVPRIALVQGCKPQPRTPAQSRDGTPRAHRAGAS